MLPYPKWYDIAVYVLVVKRLLNHSNYVGQNGRTKFNEKQMTGYFAIASRHIIDKALEYKILNERKMMSLVLPMISIAVNCQLQSPLE